jgi:hypothetical protein
MELIIYFGYRDVALPNNPLLPLLRQLANRVRGILRIFVAISPILPRPRPLLLDTRLPPLLLPRRIA